MPRLALLPNFRGDDRGDGGIRRVVEAQRRHLPTMGWSFVDDPLEADIVAVHAGNQAEGLPATTPLVNHCHGLYWYGYEWERWALKMNRDVIRSMRRADVVTAPSEWVAQTIRRGTQIDPVVLYHGVDLEEFDDVDGDSDYVLWNKTRIDAICDPTPMMRLAARASNQHFVSTIAWPPEDIPKNVELTGVVPSHEARKWVRHCAVYLNTTRETFGIGMLEAMAYGHPVLAWDHGGAREIIEHQVTGYLADPTDIEDQLLGLEWCLKHRVSAGRAARAAVAERFTWERAIQRYDDLYRTLLTACHEERPRISVVIPAYNMADLLPYAVESAAPQADEVVMVDDASTDGTFEVMSTLVNRYPNVRIVRNATNQYLAEALNVGISAARGRYIVPLDADNQLALGSLALLAESLDKDRDIDIAYGAMSVMEVAGERAGEEWTSTWPGQFDFRRQLKHQNQIPSTSMYRRRVWERVGGYRRRCRTAEDADFWCRATSFGANARKVTDAVVLRYRNRPDSMSHVQADWGWHEWYPWGKDIGLTPWIAPVDGERDDPIIPAYETPLVSVVIPVGPGHERLVLDALDSLNAQTFRWWEAIVVDDTPNGIPWVPAWARVVRSTSRGAGAARNTGMCVARGKTFTFLDADDWFQPRALELMVNAWIKAKGGFVYTDWFKGESGEVYHAPEWDGCESVLHQLPWPVTCLYGREVWDAVKGFDESLSAWEDWDFAIQVVRAGFCGTRVAVPLFHYRITTGSRRETGVAESDELKQAILERWRPYIEGEQPMPCGCQGGGGLPSLPALDLSSMIVSGTPNISAPNVAGVTSDQMILIEFTDPDVRNPLVYTGRVTGTHYPFGSDDDNRVRWVYRTDAEHLLTREEFRVYNDVDGGERLVAVGPPR